MYIITLIFYLFVLAFTITLTVRYYRTRSLFKKRERIIRSEISPVRKIKPEETAGVRRYFGVPLPPDADVYRTEGEVEWISVKNRYGTNYEFWIGGIQIQFRKEEMEDFLKKEKGDVLCEYALLTEDRKRKAYPLRINGYTVTDCFGRDEGGTGFTPYAFCTFRDATIRESRALLRPGLQGLIYLSIPALPTLALAFFAQYSEYVEGPSLLIGGLFMGLLSLMPLFLPPRRREEKKEICTVSGPLERVEKKGKPTGYCRLKGTHDRFRLPRGAGALFPAGAFTGQAEFYLRGGRGKSSGRLVSLKSWSLDERLKVKLIKRPHPWIILGSLLLLMGTVHFLAVTGGKSREVLTALPRNIQEGPRIIEKAEDTLTLKGGETVEFRDLTVIPDNPYSSDFLPVADRDDLYNSLSEGQKRKITEISDTWQDLMKNLNGMVRYRDGSPLFIETGTLVSPDRIEEYEDDLIETVNGDDLYRLDIPPIVCLSPDRFIQFISNPDTIIGRVPLNDPLLRAVYGGKDIGYFVSWLVIRYKSELAGRASRLWKESYSTENIDPSKITSPYPLFCYADFSHPLRDPASGEEIPDFQGTELFTTPMSEILRQSVLYGEGGIFTLNGTYYLDSEYDYTRPYWYEKDSYRRIGISRYPYYLLFLRRIILSLIFAGGGLMILASGLVSRLRD